jgi:hypothetical protein
MSGARGLMDRAGPALLLFWAGLSTGVAFLATPAKFLAPSLSLPVALDVGRQTFRIYNGAEVALLALALLLSAFSPDRRRWWLWLALPGAVVFIETIWLLPALDLRVSALLDGGPAPESSLLHPAYIALELAKLAALLAIGLSRLRPRRPRLA